MPLDVGYASETIGLKNSAGEIISIGGQNGSTQLLISVSFIDEILTSQLHEMDTLLSLNALAGIQLLL